MARNDKRLECPLCSTHRSLEVQALAAHLRSKHDLPRHEANRTARAVAGVGVCPCPYCDDMLRTPNGVLTHAKRIHNVDADQVLQDMGTRRADADLPNEPGIYAIHHPETRRVYIGQTVDMGRRVYQHRVAFGNTTHPNALMMLDFMLMTEGQDYEYSVVMRCPLELLSYHEIHVVRELNALETGYNLARIGSRATSSNRMAEEHPARQRIGRILAGLEDEWPPSGA